jgi:hypothetical protein
LCDFDEAAIFQKGSILAALRVPSDLRAVMRIPFDPCLADGPGCPDHITPDNRALVAVTFPNPRMAIRITDDLGATVAKGDLGAIEQVLKFTIAADFRYVPPAASVFDPLAPQYAGTAAGEKAYRGRHYFMQLYASPEMVPGQEFEVRIAVESTNTGVFCPEGTVDLGDFGQFPRCMTGPVGAILEPICACFDSDGDSDVDLRDFAAFESAFAIR